jgi:hypothetical protein
MFMKKLFATPMNGGAGGRAMPPEASESKLIDPDEEDEGMKRGDETVIAEDDDGGDTR